MSIERKIVIGLITSTEFIEQIQGWYSVRYLESSMAKRIATWCMEYFDKYQKAPGSDIEGIYFEKLKKGLPKDIAEEIEEDILPNLSDESIEDPVNITYLVDQTFQHFSEKRLEQRNTEVQSLISEGKISEAERVASEYKPLSRETVPPADFSKPEILQKVERAFREVENPLFTYPKQLGSFWNAQFTRGAFIALMASEKRGKSYWLLDMVTRAVRQKVKVAFFQAGDMTEDQQIRRFCIHLARKSDNPKYCGKMMQPVRDCIHNQRDTCSKSERECSFGVFPTHSPDHLRKEITFAELQEAYEDNPDYLPCHNCEEYLTKPIGAVWLEMIEATKPLEVKEASKVFHDYFIQNKRQLMLSTHPNNTLSVKEIRNILNQWQKQYNFIPDMIVVDYADLLTSGIKGEFRHQQNEIWKDLRSLSQERNALVITVTQADANSYDRNVLSLKNFSEDKRKYAHVTAMYGLNQDPQGREKKIGVMRINELVIREGYFDSSSSIYVLQNLSRGLPCLGSFF